MTKTIDTLIPDIESMLKEVIQGNTRHLPPEMIAQFSINVADKVDKMLKARDKGRAPKTLYISEYGKPCRKQLWYAIREEHSPEALSPANLIKFLYGDILEEMVLMLARAAGHEVTDEQKVCEFDLPFDWKLRGRMDAKIDGVVIDVKSASTQSFKKFTEGKLYEDDPFGYIPQLSAYAAHEGDGFGGFLAIEKQLGNLHFMPIENVPLDVLNEEYTTQLVLDMEGTMPPARHFEDVEAGKSGNKKLCTSCAYCPYKTECWKDANGGVGIRTFIYSNGPVFLTEVKRVPDVPEVK